MNGFTSSVQTRPIADPKGFALMMFDAAPAHSSVPAVLEKTAPPAPASPPPPPSLILKLPPAEMVLLAMADILDSDIAQLSATKEEIAVKAFKMFPQTFAMRSFGMYLDSNKVYVQLAKGKPMQARDWIRPIENSDRISSYRLTDKGLKAAQQIVKQVRIADRKRERGPKLTMEEYTELKQLFVNPAFLKRRDGKMIGMHDARQFWGITRQHLAHNRFLRVDELLRKAQTEAIIDYHCLDRVRLKLVVDFHAYLIKNFSNVCA